MPTTNCCNAELAKDLMFYLIGDHSIWFPFLFSTKNSSHYKGCPLNCEINSGIFKKMMHFSGKICRVRKGNLHACRRRNYQDQQIQPLEPMAIQRPVIFIITIYLAALLAPRST